MKKIGKDEVKIGTIFGILIFGLLLIAAIIPLVTAPNIVGLNYKNVTVRTYVNITNAKPEVLNMTIYEASNFNNTNLTVNAGTTKILYCNATVRDWNGFNDITNVSGVIFNAMNSTVNSTDNNNTHYTNSSCTLNASLTGTVGWYVCSFDVWYYANNGTWTCNVTVQDTYNKTGTGVRNTTFNAVYALNVTDGIDFGNLGVEEFSEPDRVANITNLGNMGINITVEGYGVTRGDGLAMNCSVSGNITVSSERFSLVNGTPWLSKTPLNSSAVRVDNLTMPKQTIHNVSVVNSTFWELYIPPNPAGNCTGFVIFTAVAP